MLFTAGKEFPFPEKAFALTNESLKTERKLRLLLAIPGFLW